MIRQCVHDQVARCLYVSEVDKKRANGDTGPVDSFRKLKWLEQRAERCDSFGANTALDDDGLRSILELDAPSEMGNAEHKVNASASKSLDPAVIETEYEENASDAEETNEFHADRAFQNFMTEMIASDVDVEQIEHVDGVPSDPLGAVSIPSKREGHSLTMCLIDEMRLLVVFGGRLLRDLTVLLPTASHIDPLKLERVRYSFSNAVYSYDIDTKRWALAPCRGRHPRERSDHVAAFLTPYYLLVHGGRGRHTLLCRDLFVLCLRSWQWSEVDTRTRPSERYWHAWCVTENDVYLFGGKSDIEIHSDLQHLKVDKLRQLLHQRETTHAESSLPTDATNSTNRKLLLPVSWTAPGTVGEPPSARFGMRMLPLTDDRVAVVGGWSAKRTLLGGTRDMNHPAHILHQQRERPIDLYILDTATMIWTRPHLSLHVCAPSVPMERFQFECVYSHDSILVFGGYMYTSAGVTDEYQARKDTHSIYKLHLPRMIWRKQVLSASDAALVAAQQMQYGSHLPVCWDSKGGEQEESTGSMQKAHAVTAFASACPHDDPSGSQSSALLLRLMALTLRSRRRRRTTAH